MRIRFWGTRGSIPKPGPTTVRYGGNTSCVEIQSPGGTRLILDCGTGAHALGQSLMASGEKPLRGHILIGHTHWDHIQGLPFFTPLFIPGNVWDIHAPQGLGPRIRETLAGQMQYTYFPVRLEELGATIQFHDLLEGTFQIGDVRISTHYLNHPAVTLGYRLECAGVVVVYATDHEPHARPIPGSGAPHPEHLPLSSLHREDQRHAEFLSGADLVIHDAQYTAAEYPDKVNWGHCTVDFVVALARQAHVRRLALFHHDPLRTDDALDEVVLEARASVTAAGSNMEVFAAAEGQVIDLAADPRSTHPPMPLSQRRDSIPAMPANMIALVAGDPATEKHIADALEPGGLRTVSIDASSPALIEQAILVNRPGVVFLERRSEGWNALETCVRLRSSSHQYVREMPLVVVSSTDDVADMADAFEKGATDWITLPFSGPFVRSRVRAWMMRARARWTEALIPPDEEARLVALASLKILDTLPEERFDRITRLAVRALGVPYAGVHFIDRERQWVKSHTGSLGIDFPRDVSLCAHVIFGNDVLVVPDGREDPRHGDNPMFQSNHHIRFYAGVPLHSPSGHAVGTLCILDQCPRQFDEEDVRALNDVAALAENELRVR